MHLNRKNITQRTFGKQTTTSRKRYRVRTLSKEHNSKNILKANYNMHHYTDFGGEDRGI